MEYERRQYVKLHSISPESEPRNRLAANGIHFLLASLGRAKSLYEETVMAINEGKSLAPILTTRAHFEVTAAIGYFERKLSLFYSGQLPFEELDDILKRLLLGARKYVGTSERPAGMPQPINALTMIDEIDKWWKTLQEGENDFPKAPFRETYEVLSEWCHPNWAALSMHSELPEPPDGSITFPKNPRFEETMLGILTANLSLTIYIGLNRFDVAWKNLFEQEKRYPFLFSGK